MRRFFLTWEDRNQELLTGEAELLHLRNPSLGSLSEGSLSLRIDSQITYLFGIIQPTSQPLHQNIPTFGCSRLITNYPQSQISKIPIVPLRYDSSSSHLSDHDRPRFYTAAMAGGRARATILAGFSILRHNEPRLMPTEQRGIANVCSRVSPSLRPL